MCIKLIPDYPIGGRQFPFFYKVIIFIRIVVSFLIIQFSPSVLILQGHYCEVIYRVIRNDFRGFNNLPPRSPEATPCDFFLWGYVKDQVYVPPLPASIPELKVRIRAAIETITSDTLQIVWNELDYRIVVVESQRVHI